MTFLSDRVAWLRRTVKAADGVAVTYVAGEDAVELQAVKGRRLAEVDRQIDAADVAAEEPDWIVDPADLVVDGTQIVPEPGHQIQEVDGDGVTWTYEVMDLEDEPCWRWSDPHRLARRIHTKLVDSE